MYVLDQVKAEQGQTVHKTAKEGEMHTDMKTNS